MTPSLLTPSPGDRFDLPDGTIRIDSVTPSHLTC